MKMNKVQLKCFVMMTQSTHGPQFTLYWEKIKETTLERMLNFHRMEKSLQLVEIVLLMYTSVTRLHAKNKAAALP